MAVGTAIASPLLDSGQVRKYAYRHRMGMVPSAEFLVVQDDFVNDVASNVVAGGLWEAAVADVGGAIALVTTATKGATGVISLTSDGVSEGASIWTNKQFQLVSGKRTFIEMRFQTDDVSDNAVQFGLSDLTAVTNPEDLWTTVAANVLAFGLLDGSAYPQLLADEGNAGTAVVTQTERAITADTWTTMAIFYDGVYASGWVNGDKVLTTSTTIPESVALALFIGHLNGNGAAPNTTLVDYIRIVSER